MSMPGLQRNGLHPHEYGRCGALNLFAAFDTRTGKVSGQTAGRKRPSEFIAFLEHLDREIPASVRTIPLVLDNLRRHQGKQGQAGNIPNWAKSATLKLTLRNARLNGLDGSWGWASRVGLLT
jgi:hypothetical protein